MRGLFVVRERLWSCTARLFLFASFNSVSATSENRYETLGSKVLYRGELSG